MSPIYNNDRIKFTIGPGGQFPPLTGEQIEEKRAFAYLKGRMFERWIDIVGGVARSNGYNENDLIENVAYTIESIYRDEIFVERDLIVDSATLVAGTTYTVKIDGSINKTPLRNTMDNFYNNAIFYDNTNGNKGYVSGYVGATKTLTVVLTSGGITTNDKIALTNINGDNRIDYASFDKLGNTTDGSRMNWKFRLSINKSIKVNDLINKLCFESHIIKLESYGKIRLIALDSGPSVATWGSPLKQNGVELAGAKLSNLDNLFTDFRIKYAYDYGKREYTKEYSVNKNGFTVSSSLTTEQTLCLNAETDYKLKKDFTYNCDYIYDDATARSLIQKLVLWFTKRRLMPVWYGSIKNYIQYEKGDIIKINYAAMIPNGLNNIMAFMIYSKEINLKKKIVLSFIEL